MILHLISDLHIRTHADNNRVVTRLLRELREAWTLGNGDLVVITGDITDDGKEKQYKHALDLLEPFAGRLILVPGNHDYGRLGNFYDKRCVERFHTLRSKLFATIDSRDLGNGKGVEFLKLDTCLRTGSVVDFAQGKVGWWKRQWLKLELARIRKKGWKSVVVMHHSPLCSDWWLRLQDAKEFLGVVLGHADYVLCGHTHGTIRHYYPMGLPEELAQTWIREPGALFQGKGPTRIEVE